ncbi:MAG: AAA family ATPase [Nostoc sp. ChiSLP01]|nr:AAA family ATPase [Nostoc sp. CmiSLP01]MDZ8287327.1 AAA family ATPase [Nostoc sp. ChiSLP01]
MVSLVSIPGYHLSEKIYDSFRTVVYRGYRKTNSLPVAIKLLKNPYPTFNELLTFRNQYAIAKNIISPLIIQTYNLEAYQQGYALVMEDFGGISLKDYCLDNQIKYMGYLEEFLQIAIAITKALDILYHERIIHKDIKPSNILINPQTKQVKLIDFGIASLLPRETQTLVNPNVIEGTLAYISPEQTGRMNRGIDYRTDFYSLGVTFYELLTGELPFQSQDPMELVHCHIAKMPAALGNSEKIPQVLSEIVMKLMAKNAEDRYQSALGLQQDLAICLEQLQSADGITNFAIAQRDLSDRFLIPEKLYGRETQVKCLLDAFARVANGSTEIILVAGFSGIGKTAIINEVHKPIVQQHGYFIKGKFDQLNRNIPFSAFVQTFRDLMAQLLSENQQQLANWKAKILQAVGENGQVIVEVIPELERLIGTQPPAIELSGSAAQNRFNLVFQKFVRVFTSQEHPLVIFLDDLQWADSASLKLLQLLVKDASNLLILGAYRDNEVSPVHPFMLAINEIIEVGTIVNTINLQPLTEEHINQLVAETLNCELAIAQPLTELVYQKAQGNPFFTNQFIKALHEQRFIQFDRDAGCWLCDIIQIKVQSLTDDVVEFMAQQLQKLPQQTQEVLKLAACIGAQFDLHTLAIVFEQSEVETATALWKALQEGLIVPLNETYKFFQADSGDAANNQTIAVPYKFLHDRVQQAAYYLIPKQERTKAHYQIGQLLLKQISSTAIEEQIFVVVNQLNYGMTLITNQIERDKLAQLNLLSGRKARAATAYQAACEYAENGLNLLGEKAWQRQYEMTLNLHELAAEVTALCGQFEQMHQWVDAVIHHAKTAFEQVSVHIVKIQALAYQSQLTQAIYTGISIFQKLGIEFPEHPTLEDIQQEIQEITTLIGDRAIEDLFYLPAMVNTEKLAIMRLAASFTPVCYISSSLLFPLVVSLQIKSLLQYGNHPVSPFSYVSYGTLLNNFLQDVTAADRFSQLAYRLASEPNAKDIRSATFVPLSMFLYHRKSHLRQTLPILQAGYQAGLETGSLEFVGYNIHGLCLHSYWCSQPLAELEAQIYAYIQQLLKLKLIISANSCLVYWEIIVFLLDNPNQIKLSLENVSDEEKLVSHSLASNDLWRVCTFYLHRAILRLLLGNVAQALVDIVKARNYIGAVAGSTIEVGLYFYDSLIVLATVPNSEIELAAQQQRVQENQFKLQFWAEYAPMNYLHKWQLVEAEKYRVLGQKSEAIDFYDAAIAGAKANGYIQETALANELAAKFFLAQNKELIARAYMQEAHYCYQLWGAVAKVKDLETRYSQLLITSVPRIEEATISTGTTNTASIIHLDIATVMKASQAITGEIMLDKLLSSLMKTLIENAGAQRGYLILSIHEQLLIEAEGDINSDRVTVLQSVPTENCQFLPESIINYVARTKEIVILNDAMRNGKFTKDIYIKESQIKSILCVPLINQGKLISIVYLENNLTTGAFTTDRVEVLQILSSQAAISIENAKLYNELYKLNKAYERFVPRQFLEFLDKDSIVEVKLGDQVQLEMSVLFSDIRDFTTLSETMTPENNFKFINSYLSCMEPAITENHGFIDKYIGDAIMAIFSGEADNAVKAAIAMLHHLTEYNQQRINFGDAPIKIGIGINTGSLMLGTVGGQNRMDTTVISDSVNLSSRVESLTKNYGVPLLITQQTYTRLKNPSNYAMRSLDTVKVKGKSELITVYEVFDADPMEIKQAKLSTKTLFEQALVLYNQENFATASKLFTQCLETCASDGVAQIYLHRCEKSSAYF